MSPSASSVFTVTEWKEETLTEYTGGGKLTHGRVAKAFRGELEGTSRIDYLMLYDGSGNARFGGYETFDGSLAGREGRLVFAHEGTASKDGVIETWTLVPELGGGELAGVRGSVQYNSGHAAEYPITIEYTLP